MLYEVITPDFSRNHPVFILQDPHRLHLEILAFRVFSSRRLVGDSRGQKGCDWHAPDWKGGDKRKGNEPDRNNFV